MRFAGQVKKTEGGISDQVGLPFFSAQVVIVTAAGHFSTLSLARKASPGLDAIQEPRIRRHRNTQREAGEHKVEQD